MSAWRLSHRFDVDALPLADRHYNRRKIGSPQFVPPGRCIVLLTECKRREEAHEQLDRDMGWS